MVLIEKEKEFSALMQMRFNDPDYCDAYIIADDGTKFYGAKYALRCGSEVFHKMLSNNMREKISGKIQIRDAASDIIEVMLSFMHGGKCVLDPTNLLPVMSIAQRYQVNHLTAVCKDFQAHHFSVDSANCFCILNQTYKFPESPQGLRQQCQHVILQSFTAQQQRGAMMPKGFLDLSYQMIEDISKIALPYMFLHEPFPAGYVNFAVALLGWLDHDQTSRQSKAINLLSSLEFEALGLEGIVKISGREFPQKNWVRNHPALEQKVLNALSIANMKSTKFTSSKVFNCQQGRWTLICRGGCSKRQKGATVMATFDTSETVDMHTYFSPHGHSGCALSIVCKENVRHILLAAGGGGNTDAVFSKPIRHQPLPKGIVPNEIKRCCAFSHDAEAGWALSHCHGTSQAGGLSYVHPFATEIEQCWTSSHQNCITILARPKIPTPK